jgi:hypothetical protein
MFFLLRDAKGVITRGGSDAQRTMIEEILTKSLELWAHAQSLASSTFYSHEEIELGRAAYQSVVSVQLGRGDATRRRLGSVLRG